MQPGDNNGWSEWSKHVLIELKRLDADMKTANAQLSEIKLEIAMLKVKSSLWGALSGAASMAIFWFVSHLSK